MKKTISVSTATNPSATGWAVPWRIRDALIIYIISWFILPFFAVIAITAFAGQKGESTQALIITTSFYVIALSVISGLTWCLRRNKVSRRKLGLTRPDHILKAIGWVLLGFIVYIAASWIISLATTALGLSSAHAHQKEEFSGQFNIFFLFAFAIGAPIVEELFFRGFLLPALAKRWGFAVGVLVSGVLFAIAHGELTVGLTVFVLGVALAFLYKKTNSILPGIVLHVTINMLAATTLF